jgi:hypothetical protein
MGLLQLDESGTVGAKALIPNPALRPFQFLIGVWRTTGTHPIVPNRGKADIRTNLVLPEHRHTFDHPKGGESPDHVCRHERRAP